MMRKNFLSTFAIVLSLTAFAISSNSIPPLITTIAKQISVDYQSLGIIIVIQFASFFAAAFIGGFASHKFSINCKVLTSLGLIITSFTLLCGFKINSFLWLKFWAIPLGFGGGLVETFGSIMIARYEKPNSSRLLNLSQVFFCIGAIVAPQAVSIILFSGVYWRYIFVIFSLVILLIAAIFVIFAKNKKDFCESQSKIPSNQNYSLFKDFSFYLLSATLFIYVTFESMFVCWIAVYFEKALSCAAHASALRLSIFWFGLILGRLLVGVLPHCFTLWHAMFAGSFFMLANSFLACFFNSATAVSWLVFLTGFGAGPLWPTTVAICHSVGKNITFTSNVIAAGALGVVIGSFLGSAVISFLGFSFFFPVVMIGWFMLLCVSFLASRKCRIE